MQLATVSGARAFTPTLTLPLKGEGIVVPGSDYRPTKLGRRFSRKER